MTLNGKRIFLAGATGFIGANLVIRLLSLGCKVRAALHKRPAVIQDDAIEYVQADLTSQKDCKRVVDGMDYVFLCAANTSGAAVMAATPMVHVTPNILMNSLLLEAAYEAGVKKFLFLSSSTVYPQSGTRPVKEEEMLDGEPYDKYFFVGWMKRYTEILCRMYGEKLAKPMTTIVLRPTNVYGPYDDFGFETSHVTAALIRKVADRHNPIEVWGTGEDVRDVIYVDDMVNAMVMAMEKLESYTAINIGMGKAYSVMEILQTALEIDGYTDAKVVFDATKPTMIPIRLIDTTKAETVLGFQAKTSLHDGIRKTIEWYRQNFNNQSAE